MDADNLQVHRAIFVPKHPTCYDVKGVWVSEGTTAEDCRRTRGTRDSLLVPKREPAVQPPNDRQDREINIKIAIQWIALDL